MCIIGGTCYCTKKGIECGDCSNDMAGNDVSIKSVSNGSLYAYDNCAVNTPDFDNDFEFNYGESSRIFERNIEENLFSSQLEDCFNLIGMLKLINYLNFFNRIFSYSFMRRFCFILILFSNKVFFSRSNCDYENYYRSLNYSDSLIFIEHKYIEGEKIYENTFKKYNFIWIEDCLKIAQVALIYNDTLSALKYLKIAIENGLELDKLKYLNQGCVCNYLENNNEKIEILNQFVSSNLVNLKKYSNENREKYLKLIDKEKLKFVIKTHVEDELYKVYKENTGLTSVVFFNRRKSVLDSFYTFLDLSFTNGNYIGNQNLGYYSDNLSKELLLDSFSINYWKNFYLNKYNLKEDSIGYRPIPVNTDQDYFNANILFVTFYHEMERFYQLLKKYYEPLIKCGFLHPREYAVIASKLKKFRQNIFISPLEYSRIPSNREYINRLRYKYYLPSIEVDQAKHDFEHQYHIRLFFGFFNFSR